MHRVEILRTLRPNLNSSSSWAAKDKLKIGSNKPRFVRVWIHVMPSLVSTDLIICSKYMSYNHAMVNNFLSKIEQCYQLSWAINLIKQHAVNIHRSLVDIKLVSLAKMSESIYFTDGFTKQQNWISNLS